MRYARIRHGMQGEEHIFVIGRRVGFQPTVGFRRSGEFFIVLEARETAWRVGSTGAIFCACPSLLSTLISDPDAQRIA